MIDRHPRPLPNTAAARPSTWLLWMIHLSFVTFVYLNVLFPKLTIGGASVSKAAFTACLLLFGMFAALNPERRSSNAFRFIGIAFVMISSLAVIGAIKGNRIEHILVFVAPVLMLLSIPVIQLLTEHYGRDTYIRHIAISASLLAAYMVYLYLAKGPLRLPDESLLLPEQPGFTSISFPGGAPKVIAVTAGFFPAGLVAAYYLSVTGGITRYYLSIIVIAAGVYIGQTIGIWVASVFALFTGALVIRSTSLVRRVILWTTIPLVVVVTVGNAIARGEVLDPSQVFDTKIESFDQKQMQTVELLAVFIASPIFGGGMGYNYQISEIPSLSDPESVIVEVAYPMVLASTGLIGAAFYAFIYLYYPLLYIFRRRKDGATTAIALSHCAILVASTGLPYLWSGGIGFFFLAFLVAWMHVPKSANEAALDRAPIRRLWLQPAHAAVSPRLAVIGARTHPTRRQVGVGSRP